MTTTTLCEVVVSVAVSETGIADCCIADSNRVQQRQRHAEWMVAKRSSKTLWSIKTVRVNVPMPLTFEDMTKE